MVRGTSGPVVNSLNKQRRRLGRWQILTVYPGGHPQKSSCQVFDWTHSLRHDRAIRWNIYTNFARHRKARKLIERPHTDLRFGHWGLISTGRSQPQTKSLKSCASRKNNLEHEFLEAVKFHQIDILFFNKENVRRVTTVDLKIFYAFVTVPNKKATNRRYLEKSDCFFTSKALLSLAGLSGWLTMRPQDVKKTRFIIVRGLRFSGRKDRKEEDLWSPLTTRSVHCPL